VEEDFDASVPAPSSIFCSSAASDPMVRDAAQSEPQHMVLALLVANVVSNRMPRDGWMTKSSRPGDPVGVGTSAARPPTFMPNHRVVLHTIIRLKGTSLLI